MSRNFSEHSCKSRIILYVMAWFWIIVNLHTKYTRLADTINPYIQSIVLKKYRKASILKTTGDRMRKTHLNTEACDG